MQSDDLVNLIIPTANNNYNKYKQILFVVEMVGGVMHCIYY